MSSLDTNIFIYGVHKTQIVLLLAKKISVLEEYLDYADVFFEKVRHKAF